MSSNPLALLRAALRGPPAAPDSDAELLARYVAARDEAAFAALVRRHGPMVLGVCRRRLGNRADAEDAFQATFLVLARDAARIGNRAALPGWLFRVAHLVALKQRARSARRPAEPLAEEPAGAADPEAEAATRELRAALDRELAALPDKLRSAVVLCCLEERSNAEAGRLLGCPAGTIDSRLSAARRKLRARLARRGWAPPALAALDALLRPPPADAALLQEPTVRAAAACAAGGRAADPVSSLADGVSPMGPAKLKSLAAAGMSLAMLGTVGLGLLHAPADDAAKPDTTADAKADPPKQGAPKAEEKPAAEAPPPLKDEAAVRAALNRPAQVDANGLSLLEFLDLLYRQHGVVARFDMAAYVRANGPPDFRPYEAKVNLPLTRGMSVADMLTEALSQIGSPGGPEAGSPLAFTYRVRGNQVLIVPAYIPPVIPGSGANVDPGAIAPEVDHRRLLEQIVGEPVSLAIDAQPLAEAVRELRKLTGANIVIDNRCRDDAKQPVSGSFSDVRLLTALTVLADMCDLKPVAMNNVYYVTTPANAAKLQKAVNRDLFGEPPASAQVTTVPAGFVTDGYQFFPRTADMKPVDPATVFGFSAGGAGGNLPRPVPAPAPAPVPEKK